MKITETRKHTTPSTARLPRAIVAIAVPLVLVPTLMVADTIVGGNAPVPDKPTPVASDAAGGIAAMVERLSDDSYLVREKSTTDLWKMGKVVLPALRQASAGGDPEATDRADELILYISAGVLFDSPEEVKTLVLKFSRSKIDTKLSILQKLMGMGHWKQVLHLAKLEERQELRTQMSKIVKAAAIRAARDAIAKGDLDLASEILEMNSDDAELMVLKAWFQVRQGKLKQELRKAASLSGKNGALWRMSLHRAAGDVSAAISEAQKAGQQPIADALRVLEGDALPWLRQNTQRGNLDVIYSMGCKIQQARLEGDQKKADILARELARLGRNDDTIARTVSGLAANGYREEAVSLLVKHDVAAAFDYFDTTESPQKCLEVLGIPKDAKPPYTAWVKNYTAKAIEKEDDELYDQLLALASFLTNHGQGEHAKDVLTPLMTALEEDGSDEWFDLLSVMSTFGLGAEAVYFIEKRGNEDGEADLGVKKMFQRIPSKYLSHTWDHLKKRNNQDVDKALHEISLLAGVIADLDHEVDKLHKALADEVADKAGADKETRMAALYYFAGSRNDYAKASRMADKMAAESDRWKGSKQGLDAVLLRWKKMEPIYAENVEKNPGNYLNLTKLYITQRKLGREKQALELLDRVLLLSMGSAKGLSLIGWEIHEAGYEDEAVKIWLQAATVAEPEGHDYDQAIAYLAHYGQSIYHKKQWKKAAAISEVNAQLSMRGRSSGSINLILRTRFYADFAQGMHLLQKGQKSLAITKLNACRKMIPGDGILADDFFPHIRKAGIGKLYDQWFEESYNHILAACKLYPKSHNSRNTAAWLASRSIRRLDEALKHSEAALTQRPTQGAYLDTMAEVWFAKGNRDKAIEWSQKAVDGSIANAQGNPRSEKMVFSNYKQLNKQLERFKNDPLPNASR